jgi:hypothetical protein
MSAFASPRVCSLALLAALLAMPGGLAAQVSDQHEDANSFRTDAFFGTPNIYAPTPQANIFATTPGLEQQVRRSQFTINGLAPLSYNSNPAALTTGGTSSAEFSPVLGVSWSTPVLDLPFRFTANVRAELDRFTQFPGLDFDKLAASARVQYVDANNDQAYSPYIAYSPRWDFAPFYRAWFDTRQDLNFGVNKIFNFDANFQRVAFSGDTFGQTAWSFGVTAVIQRRFRDPAPGSWAAILVPSMTYVISPELNLSAGIALERRAFDSYYGFNQEDWLVEPIVTFEFVLPESWFGSAGTAAVLGRPAIDFQAAYEKNWSNLPAANFSAWHLGVAMKLGWRF